MFCVIMCSMTTNVPLEEHEQKALALWLDQQGFLWFHVPNEGLKSVSYHAKMSAMGLKSGVPDNFIIHPTPPNNPTAKGVAIELKRVAGGKVSKEQRAWISKLSEAGWEAHICCGHKEAITLLIKLGYTPRKIVEVQRYV